MKKLTFFFCGSKIISTFAPLKTKITKKKKTMNQTFNIISLLSIIILLIICLLLFQLLLWQLLLNGFMRQAGF